MIKEFTFELGDIVYFYDEDWGETIKSYFGVVIERKQDLHPNHDFDDTLGQHPCTFYQVYWLDEDAKLSRLNFEYNWYPVEELRSL